MIRRSDSGEEQRWHAAKRDLGGTPSGFYAWCKRPELARATRERHLKVLVQASFDASKQRYGSLRIHEDLLEQHERVSRKRVIRLMQEVAPIWF